MQIQLTHQTQNNNNTTQLKKNQIKDKHTNHQNPTNFSLQLKETNPLPGLFIK